MQYPRFQQQRESRSTRSVEVFLRRQDGREIKTLLTNVSSRGCRLRPRQELTINERIRIEVPRLGSVAATVRWSLDGNAGAEFIPQSDVWEEVSKSGSPTAFPERRDAEDGVANDSNLDL